MRPLAQHGHGRREQGAERGHPHDQDRYEQTLRSKRGGQQAHDDRGDQRNRDGNDSAPTICLPARQRREQAFDCRRRQKCACDQQRASPQIVQTQRCKHVQDAKGHPGQHGQPQTRADSPVAYRGQGLPQSLRHRLVRGPDQEGGHYEYGSGDCCGREDRPGPDLVGRGPDQGAKQRAGHGRAQRYPQQFPSPVFRRRGGQPGQTGRPGTGPA